MVDDGGHTASRLELRVLSHVAIAVQSIEEAAARLGRLGFGPWTQTWDIQVPASHLGALATMGLRAAFASAAPIAIELIEPTNDDSPVAAFLRERGEGVQHVGYQIDDMDSTLALARRLGIAVDWLVSDERGTAVAFLAPEAFLGVSIELIRKEPPVSLDAWRRPQDA
jgi:methylmalonyl-CoA epimerase